MRVCKTSHRRITVTLNGQQTRIGSFAVGIEPRGFQRLARRNVRSPLVKDLVASLDGRALVIGVDRLDYSKGPIQRLEALHMFLSRLESKRRLGEHTTPHGREPAPRRHTSPSPLSPPRPP